MTKQKKIDTVGAEKIGAVHPDAAPAAVEMHPVAALTLSPLNPRQEADAAGIETLAANIRAHGLIHNLAGLRNAEGVEIVAGGRRLRALQALAAEDAARFGAVPVQVTEDAALAAVWAASENAVREPLHPADEIASYGRMAVDGASVPEIALAYGASEARVHRRLKLADLPQPVLAALRANEITLASAAIFTLCHDEALALSVLETVRGAPIGEHALRGMLVPTAVAETDRRAVFVGEADYRAAGGRITPDLFTGTALYEDPELLQSLTEQKLQRIADDLRGADGWLWTEVQAERPHVGYYEIEDRKLERLYPIAGELTEAQRERLEELTGLAECEADGLTSDEQVELAELERLCEGDHTPEQKAHAGVILYVMQDGGLGSVAGLVRREEVKSAREAGVLAKPCRAADAGDGAPRSPYSAKLTADMEAVRLAAVQKALMAKPELVLDLLAFALAPESGDGACLFGLRPEAGENAPSVAEGFEADPWLHCPEPDWHERSNLSPQARADAFAVFRSTGKRARNRVLAAGIARTLPKGCDLLALIARETGAETRSVWRPTVANFLGRVGAGYLDGLIAELLALPEDDERRRSFGKMKKKEKAIALEEIFAGDPDRCGVWRVSAEDRARIDAWVPACVRWDEAAPEADATEESGA